MARCKGWFCTELLRSLRLGWLIAVSYVLTSSLGFVSLAFCGHVGESTAVLQAAGLALSVIMLSGTSVAVGIVSTLDTLATQAWGGGNHRMVGVYMQRGALILCLAVCAVLSIWFNVESVLNLLHQPPEVVDLSVQYIHVFSCALPALYLFLLLRTYLQVQNITYPFLFTGLCGNTVNAVAHYLFLFVAGWGIRGSAAALALTWYSLLFSLLAIIYVRRLHVKTWGGWSRECLQDWGQFARFSALGLFMVIIEWITFEVGFFIGGLVGNVQQAIHSLLTTCTYVLFAIPKALSMTAAVRVGNELGSGSHTGAKRAVLVIVAVGAVWIALTCSLMVGLKDYFPRIFTANRGVLEAMGPIVYVAAAVVLGDSLQAILGGVIRGSGRQSGGAAANFVSFWVICIPVGAVLVFVVRLGILGFWLGLLAGEMSQVFICGVIVLSIRWKKQALEAHARATQKLERQGSEPVNEKSPLIPPPIANVNSDDCSDDESFGPTPLNETISDKPVPHIWSEDEVEERFAGNRHLASGNSCKQEKPSAPVKVGGLTVILRLLTCSVFVLVLLGGVALSRLAVYRCRVVQGQGSGNSSNSSYAGHSTWPLLHLTNASNGSTSHYDCSWKFLDHV